MGLYGDSVIISPMCEHGTVSSDPNYLSQKHTWTKGLMLTEFDQHQLNNTKLITETKDLAGGCDVRPVCLVGTSNGCNGIFVDTATSSYTITFDVLAVKYEKAIAEEEDISLEKRVVAKAGKLDAKKRLEDNVQTLLSDNIVQCMSSMVDTVVF